MQKKVQYEWSKEITDTNGDIIDNDFADILTKDFINSEGVLLLVRNEGNENEGVTDRFWAYVKDGKLPANFQNANGNEINIKVPVKYHNELKKLTN